MIPGKKDAKRIEKDGPKIHKRILNDYLSSLYEKFVAEYPEDPLSFSSFCRMQPFNYLLVNFTRRNACLCTRHQNVASELKSLQALKIVETHNPDVLIKSNFATDIHSKTEHIADGKIAYNAWKKGKVQQGNVVVKEKMKLVIRGTISLLESRASDDPPNGLVLQRRWQVHLQKYGSNF